MALRVIYENRDDIPEQFIELFTERDGKWELTEIEGVKSQADVDRLQDALQKERNDHKETKDKLKPFDGIDPEQVRKDQGEITELRAKIEAVERGDGDEKFQERFDAAVAKVVDAKVKSAVTPLEQELNQTKEERDNYKSENDVFQKRDISRTIGDAVRGAAGTAKVVPSAMDDILLLGERVFEVLDDTVVVKDNVGFTPGIAPDIWITEMKEKRPHWWPASTGGGAGGGDQPGGGPNPFSRQNWNLTDQGRIVRENPEKANRLAKHAGTTVGGTKPVEKK